MSNTITITRTIPAPPEGWQYEERQPIADEEACILQEDNQWSSPDKAMEGGWASENWKHSIFAYRTKTKRLMKPVELVDKWIHDGVNSKKVIGYNGSQACVGGEWLIVEMMHREGLKVSDTHTGERRSLEVEQ